MWLILFEFHAFILEDGEKWKLSYNFPQRGTVNCPYFVLPVCVSRVEEYKIHIGANKSKTNTEKKKTWGENRSEKHHGRIIGSHQISWIWDYLSLYIYVSLSSYKKERFGVWASAVSHAIHLGYWARIS